MIYDHTAARKFVADPSKRCENAALWDPPARALGGKRPTYHVGKLLCPPLEVLRQL
jgi:hypothetical protein